MTTEEILKAAIDKFGIRNQQDMVIEECAELIQAINKHRRNANGEGLSALCGEIADVEIMLSQLRIMLNADVVIDGIKESKLKRLEETLKK